MEFADPSAEGEAGGTSNGEVRNQSGKLMPEVLRKIKGSTMYLRVTSNRGVGQGSGFFAGEPGAVVTNAHVVGMLERGAAKPSEVQVVLNKGETSESTVAGRVLAVDPDADLAIVSVPSEKSAGPLPVKSALCLQETQPVYVAGFPLGEVPGKSVTINRHEIASLKMEKGVLAKLQVDGDMLPGNSGGPVPDADPMWSACTCRS